MSLTVDDLEKITSIVVNPVIEKVDELRKDLNDFKITNSLCHKDIKKDLENLKILKWKLTGIFSVITLILSFGGSWIWSQITKQR